MITDLSDLTRVCDTIVKKRIPLIHLPLLQTVTVFLSYTNVTDM